MDLELAAAYWVLGRLPGEDLPEIAQRALEAGRDTPALRELSGEPPAPRSELRKLFEDALKQAGLGLPAPKRAALRVAHYHARRIVADEIEPFLGARAIVEEACQSPLEPDTKLRVFVGLEDEYADFTDDVRTAYYGEAYCEKVLADLRQRIRSEAKRLVEHDV